MDRAPAHRRSAGARQLTPAAPLSLLSLLALCASLWIAAPGVAAVEDAPPIASGLEERVEVQLVLLDVLVLDRRERTLPDLGIEDFELLVDGQPVALSTLDADCPWGRAPDAVKPEARPPVVRAEEGARRIVLVFDYFHMESAAVALEQAATALARWPVGGEEHMVVSLGHVVRVETPFTGDLQAVRSALVRMRDDPALYNGAHGRLTEWPFFSRLRSLFELLERVPGRKVVVLFSGPFVPDGFDHDTVYRELASLSASARAAVYPVDTGGLRSPFDGMRLGGPPKLRRLAIETGGRMTADTNDLTLAYGRARRDLGCTYTLGFADERPRLDRNRRVSIRVRRPGIRVVYPTSYVARSQERKRESLVETASMVPELFASDALAAELALLHGESSRSWAARVAIEVRLAALGARDPAAEWDLKCMLRKPSGTVVRSFKRRIVLRPAAPSAPTQTITEDLTVPPGRYMLSAVLWGPGMASPIATVKEVRVPEARRSAVAGRIE